jgi:3-isopropylmalate/(R)-2-methylmalate dehydratase small subunit
LRLEVEKKSSQGVFANAGRLRALANEADAVVDSESGRGCRVIHGKCFVVGDNIDTDQIIPAEYLTLVPSKPEEYEKLGSYAMIGLPAQWGKFIEGGAMKTEYKVIIGGGNFGCGSSREHAPVALGAAGCRAVVAESYARIFFPEFSSYRGAVPS